MNKVVLYNIIGMLIVTYIDEYYRSSSMYLCVFYTKAEKGDQNFGSIPKENYCVNIAKCLFFMLFMFISCFFLSNVHVLHAYRGQNI